MSGSVSNRKALRWVLASGLAVGAACDGGAGPSAQADAEVAERVESELVFWGFDAKAAQRAVRAALADVTVEVHEQLVMRFAHAKLQGRDLEAKTVTEYMLDFPERYYEDELAPVLVDFWERKLAEGAYDDQMRRRVEAALEATREKMKPLLMDHLRVQARHELRLEEAETAEEREEVQSDLEALRSDLGRWFGRVADAPEILSSTLSAIERLRLHATRSGLAISAQDEALVVAAERKKQDKQLAALEAKPVTFPQGSAGLSASAEATLGPVIEMLVSVPDLEIELHGHADATGSVRTNQRLSARRARAVAEALAANGVDVGRIKTVDHGEERPRGDNSTLDGRAMNRRVELKFRRQPTAAASGPAAAVARAAASSPDDQATAAGAAADLDGRAGPKTPKAEAGEGPAATPAEGPDEDGAPGAGRETAVGRVARREAPEGEPGAAGPPGGGRSGAGHAARTPVASARGAAVGRLTEGFLRSHVEPWLGTPYQFGCKDPKKGGIDCSGFVSGVYREAYGIELPNSSQLQSKDGRRVKRSQLETGDLLFFDVPRAGRVTHVAIYVGEGIMAHASSSRGVSYAQLESRYWTPRYVGARRYLR